MTAGELFNPYKRFNGALVPEAILADSGLGQGAKLLYGQLRRRAGKRGHCWPTLDSLAEDCRERRGLLGDEYRPRDAVARTCWCH